MAMAEEYWYVHVNFDCPACKRTNIEKMVLSSPVQDPNKINAAIQQQPLGCQVRKALLAIGTPVRVT